MHRAREDREHRLDRDVLAQGATGDTVGEGLHQEGARAAHQRAQALDGGVRHAQIDLIGQEQPGQVRPAADEGDALEGEALEALGGGQVGGGEGALESLDRDLDRLAEDLVEGREVTEEGSRGQADLAGEVGGREGRRPALADQAQGRLGDLSPTDAGGLAGGGGHAGRGRETVLPFL